MERWLKFALFFVLALVAVSILFKAVKLLFVVLVVLAVLYFFGIVGKRRR